MPSTRLSTPYAAQALLVLSLSAVGVQAQSSIDDMTYAGCFSSSQPLTDQGSYTYQTSGYCRPLCEDKGAKVFGLSDGSNCWCGNLLPASGSKVSDSNCDVGCNGYDKEECGGDGYWSVYTVADGSVPNYSGGSGSGSNSGSNSGSDSSSSADTSSPSPTPTSTNGGSNNNNNNNGDQTTAKPSVITSMAPGTTIVKTVPAAEATSSPESPSESSNSSGGTNVGAIAGGVVVAVLAIAAIGGGLFWFLRRKRRLAAEEEYRRNNQVSDFMRGTSERKPPATGYSSMSDSRLDPEAGQRRDSQGSIADNQDYSRRILRVANPDGN